LVHCEGASFKVTGIKFMTHAEGCSLVLTKGCDRVAALNPCQQKHPSKLSAHINWTAVHARSGRWPKG